MRNGASFTARPVRHVECFQWGCRSSTGHAPRSTGRPTPCSSKERRTRAFLICGVTPRVPSNQSLGKAITTCPLAEQNPLCRCRASGSRSTPPANPQSGKCWLTAPGRNCSSSRRTWKPRRWLSSANRCPDGATRSNAAWRQAPDVVVARVIDDGPVAAGPIVYLSAGTRAVSTLICRCMPAQARKLLATSTYDLLPFQIAATELAHHAGQTGVAGASSILARRRHGREPVGGPPAVARSVLQSPKHHRALACIFHKSPKFSRPTRVCG